VQEKKDFKDDAEDNISRIKAGDTEEL